MPIFDTFSKRQKKLRGEVPDVFTYDDIPPSLRIQICHIWKQSLGIESGDYTGLNPIYSQIQESLAAEFGLFSLGDSLHGNAGAIVSYFTRQADTTQALDMIELSFAYLVRASNDYRWRGVWRQQISADQAISDLNQRFLEHGIGYAFAAADGGGQLIRKDNEHLHKNAVMPALRLLHEEGFKGASDEYRSAHQHYRQGSYKECLNNCLKAFESTLKTICSKKKWTFNSTDTASRLIETCLNNGLLPSFMQTHLGTVKSALESAIPTIRNKLGGHGQGAQPVQVPPFYAEYLLNETASTIVFLVEAYKAIK
jgi:hypothetical protein